MKRGKKILERERGKIRERRRKAIVIKKLFICGWCVCWYLYYVSVVDVSIL